MNVRRALIIFSALATVSSTAFAIEIRPVPLGSLAANLYSYSLKVVGLAVFLMFLLAGLTYIVPALQKKYGSATGIIKDAVIGLIILASAYVILNSISSNLIQGQ